MPAHGKKLIHAYTFSFNLKDALVQLDSLYRRNEINFTNQLQMAEYCIHAGRFADASKLLQEARQIHPYKVPAIDDLLGRLQLLSEHPQQALVFYKDYLSNKPKDGFLAMYTMAKLNARLNNQSEAWRWLQLSIDNGFDFYWVLKYDKAWDNYRKLNRWQEITRRVSVPPL